MMLQELMKLPAVNPEVLGSFEQAFGAKRSEKDQRNLIRKLLFNSGKGHAGGHSATAACQWHSRSGMALQCSPYFCICNFFMRDALACLQYAYVYLTGCMVSCTHASIVEHCS